MILNLRNLLICKDHTSNIQVNLTNVKNFQNNVDYLLYQDYNVYNKFCVCKTTDTRLESIALRLEI